MLQTVLCGLCLFGFPPQLSKAEKQSTCVILRAQLRMWSTHHRLRETNSTDELKIDGCGRVYVQDTSLAPPLKCHVTWMLPYTAGRWRGLIQTRLLFVRAVYNLHLKKCPNSKDTATKTTANLTKTGKKFKTWCVWSFLLFMVYDFIAARLASIARH